jgi:hypothetical protein
MNESGVGSLLDQETLHDLRDADALPAWARAHYDSFREALLGEHDGAPFPCHFGVQSERNGDALYAFVPSPTDPDALLGLRDALLEYLDVFREHADRASLVVMFGPLRPDLGEAEAHELVWHVLQFLHVHDPEPWPADIPTDPEDPYFEFSFGGEPMFPTCRAPFYETYRSRHCPVGLEITFQPRAIFEGITADTAAGERAREHIQERLADYDDVPPHPMLGDWGVEGDREWVQYLLPEGEDAPETCPLVATREHPKATPPEYDYREGRAATAPDDRSTPATEASDD